MRSCEDAAVSMKTTCERYIEGKKERKKHTHTHTHKQDMQGTPYREIEARQLPDERIRRCYLDILAKQAIHCLEESTGKQHSSTKKQITKTAFRVIFHRL